MKDPGVYNTYLQIHIDTQITNLFGTSLLPRIGCHSKSWHQRYSAKSSAGLKGLIRVPKRNFGLSTDAKFWVHEHGRLSWPVENHQTTLANLKSLKGGARTSGLAETSLAVPSCWLLQSGECHDSNVQL